MTLEQEWENSNFDESLEIGDEVLCDCGEIKAGVLVEIEKRPDYRMREPPSFFYYVKIGDEIKVFDEDAGIIKRQKNV